MRIWRQRHCKLIISVAILIFVLSLLSQIMFIVLKEFEQFPTMPLMELSFQQSLSLKINNSDTRVVKILHQSWKNRNLPPRFRRWSRTWDECFPNWKHLLWTDEDNESFVKSYYPHFYPVWLVLPTQIERVDSVRYLYLHKYGGLYVDLDTECFRNFNHLLSDCTIVLGSMLTDSGPTAKRMPSGLVQNSFMYSQPGHKFWLDMIEAVTEIASNSRLSSIFGSYPLPEDRTGPLLLMRILKAKWHLYNRSLCVYKSEFFNPFSWYTSVGQCLTLNRMTDWQIDRCRNEFFNTSYAMQYHTQVWRQGKEHLVEA